MSVVVIIIFFREKNTVITLFWRIFGGDFFTF